MNLSINFRIFINLLRRDVKVILLDLKNIIINTVIISILETLYNGYFLPSVGLPEQFIGAFFLGSTIGTIFSMGHSKLINIKSDLEFSRFIDYQITLPISKFWLFFEYVIAFILYLIANTLPILILTLILLGNIVPLQENFFIFFLVYVISLLFISIFFLLICFSANWKWLLNNTWDRILTPMLHLGCLFYVWHRVYDFSPLIGNILLFNPITYISEGIRSSLLTNGYIPINFCLAIIIGCIILMSFFLTYAINKLLDPVK